MIKRLMMVVAVAVAGAVVSSCSGSAPAQADVVASEVESRPAPQLIAPEIPTISVAVSEPSSAAAAGIADSSASSPSTAYLRALDVRNSCNIDPGGCDFAAIALPGSPYDEFNRKVMAFRLENNLRAVQGVGEFQVRVEAQDFDDDVSYVTACSLDSIVLFDVGASAGREDDIIFDDSVVSQRVRWQMRRTGAQWRIVAGEELGKLTGEDMCGF